jgi:hypothetical protein
MNTPEEMAREIFGIVCRSFTLGEITALLASWRDEAVNDAVVKAYKWGWTGASRQPAAPSPEELNAASAAAWRKISRKTGRNLFTLLDAEGGEVDDLEPGDLIAKGECPCCGRQLEIMVGDEVGEMAVIGIDANGMARETFWDEAPFTALLARAPRTEVEQIGWIKRQVARWLQIKEEAGQTVHWPDADHSSLLERLLRGNEPLPEPPKEET